MRKTNSFTNRLPVHIIKTKKLIFLLKNQTKKSNIVWLKKTLVRIFQFPFSVPVLNRTGRITNKNQSKINQMYLRYRKKKEKEKNKVFKVQNITNISD